MHVLSIGSSVIDLFLAADNDFYKINSGKVEFNLGDKIPSEIKGFGVGGNGANVSVGLTRLEIPTTFYTFLGGDSLSREIVESLSREGVEIINHKEKTDTPPLSIIFNFEHDRIIFSNHQKKEYEFELGKNEKYDFIYLTSIGKVWQKAYRQILEYAKEHNIPIAFSPGSAQIDEFDDEVKETLAASKMYFSNKEEAEVMLEIERGKGEIKNILSELLKKGPEIVSITDGPRGAYAADKNGAYHIKPLPSDSHEKTGAGDSYAAGFFAAVLHNKSLPDAMTWGTLNSYSTLQKIGAQGGLLTGGELDKMISEYSELKAEKL